MRLTSVGGLAITFLLSTHVFSTQATAADMPLKAPRAPVVAPAFNWSGFYIGGYAGGAWSGRITASDMFSQGPDDPIGSDWSAFGDSYYKFKASFIGGGTAGINWQAAGSPLVLGLEGELGFIGLKGNGSLPLDWGYDLRFNTKVGDWYGIIAGRLGYAFDRALIYAKGGAAFIQVKASTTDTCTTGLNAGGFACDDSSINATGTKNVITWTVGGGLEYALTNNWSVKGEYLFIDLPDSVRVCGVGGDGGFSDGSTWCGTHSLPSGIHTAKFGLNYRFGYRP